VSPASPPAAPVRLDLGRHVFGLAAAGLGGIALALAVLALLAGRGALLAVRLLTVMFAIFGLLVWLPRLLADPGHP
jgi:hypothetical protein